MNKRVLLFALIFLLGALARAFAAAPDHVTITGTVYDNFGNASVGVRVGVYPLNPTAQGSNLIMANPVETNTDSSGAFSLAPVGGTYSAFFVQGNSTTPSAIIKTTLPSSGSITLSALLAQSTNVVTNFPPGGNLDMNGFTFLNMAGATIAGEPVVEGSGLAGGKIFTSSGTFAIPTNATIVIATLLAAGGGGGGGRAAATNGGGGGGGGEILQCLMLPTNGTLTVTIGAPGTAGAVTPTDGGNAADTTVSQSSAATICDAGGGAGGTKGTGSVGTGGAGGDASTEITGAAIQMFMTAGAAGSNGSAGAGGAGAGLSNFGGIGGAPQAAGLIGGSGKVLVRAY